jgi:hypothetical protein
MDMWSKMAANYRKNGNLGPPEAPKTSQIPILQILGPFLGFESVSIQFHTPKNIGKVSKMLKIGSVEAEISIFSKIRYFNENRQISL